MRFSLTTFLRLAALASAAPIRMPRTTNPEPEQNNTPDPIMIAKRAQFSCDKVPEGLSRDDCEYMAKMGMKGVGANAKADPGGGIWVGNNGPSQMKFTNRSNQRQTVVVWNYVPGNYIGSFMNAREPQVSWSLSPGQSVTVSYRDGTSGGFAAIYPGRSTALSGVGQIHQTWGEFTAGGPYATINVSRLVRMDGDPVKVVTPGKCETSMDKCVFVCKGGVNTCGKANEYDLKNCAVGSQPHANIGWSENPAGKQPEGGCQGWQGGEATVEFS